MARIARAGFYAMEHHLFQWVLQHNCLRGIAPTTGQLLREAQLCIPQDLPLSARERMLQMFLSSPSRSKRWASRWRGRWGARFGKMCTGCPMSTEELRKRVPGAKTCRLLKSRATQAAEKTSPQPMFPRPLCHDFSDPTLGTIPVEYDNEGPFRVLKKTPSSRVQQTQVPQPSGSLSIRSSVFW